MATSGKSKSLLHRIAANLATDYERRNTVRQNYLSAQEKTALTE
ncbi:MAG: hypothetical protein ACXW0Q_11190 [Methylovulum sp.]